MTRLQTSGRVPERLIRNSNPKKSDRLEKGIDDVHNEE